MAEEWLSREAQENIALTFIRSAAEKGIPASVAIDILRYHNIGIRTKTAYDYYRQFVSEKIVRPSAWSVPLNRYPGEGTRIPAYPGQKKKYAYKFGIYWMDPRTKEMEYAPVVVGFEDKPTIGRALEEAYNTLEFYAVFPGVDLAKLEIRFEGWSERGKR